MGCGSSMNQLDNVAPHSSSIQVPVPQNLPDVPEAKSHTNFAQNYLRQCESPENKKQQDRVNTSSTQEMKHEPMKHVPEGRAFIFGQSSNQRKIVLMDCEKMQFSILSSRSQLPNTPHKYQPKDVIFQQSQELLASNLFNKNSHPPYNFMFITFISDETIFLCGGVNFDFDFVSEESFFFRVSSISSQQPQIRRKKGGNNLVGNKFEKLQCMRYKRYSHMGAYFKIGRLGYIYAFGGRNQDDQLLNNCEQYSIEQKKWREITPMKHKRSTGFSLIFKSKIYVFGGYTGDKKRSKSIQVYDPFKNYWQCLNVKLHRGIEAGLIFSLKSNQILIMGGNMEFGSLKSVIKVNLADQTYIWDSNMKNERMLQKGVKYNDTIFVFGGDFQDHFQKYSLKDRKWKDHQFSYNDFISTEDANSYVMAVETLQVNFDQSLYAKNDNNANEFERYHIFGNDNYPCILEVNMTKFVLKKKVVPMTLRLRSHMGVTKIVEGKYFLCGGIDCTQQKLSKASFIYYAGTNKAIEVAKMQVKKYAFAICSNGKFVYIFGGKNQAGDIFKQCEKYSLAEEKWVELPSMPNQRANAKTLVVGSKILIFGGNDTLQTISQIDIFDTLTDTFWSHKQSLSISSEIKSVFLDPKSSKGVYILSNNEILGKYFCHYLSINVPQSNQQEEKQEKIEENFSIVRDIEEKQINLKVLPFHHSFVFEDKIFIINSKGVFQWQPTHDAASSQFNSQIVINQVQMLQFPIEKFSSP